MISFSGTGSALQPTALLKQQQKSRVTEERIRLVITENSSIQTR